MTNLSPPAALCRAWILGAAAFVCATGLAGCGGDDGLDGPGIPITVYTRNLYLGSEIFSLATVPSFDDIPAVAAELWANVQASDFPSRAKVLAAEIVALGPDLVALQEVSLYRLQTPSDYQPGAAPNASEVGLDFLASLLEEIGALGGGYTVAGEAPNGDVELPVSDGAGGRFDLRLTDRDVILARAGVTTSAFEAIVFDAKASFTVGGAGGVPFALVRGASRLEAEVDGARVTFVNSHLEVGSLEAFQMIQANELLAWLQPIPGPILLLGDFNSNPGMGSYNALTGTFRDAYTSSEPGFTCCQQGDLMNPTSVAANRIDLILYKGRFRVNDVQVTGADPATGRTPSGLWASDHLGVVGTLELVP